MIRLSILVSVLFCNLSSASAGLVLATFLDGADGTTGLYTYNDAAIGATGSSVTLDVQSDRNGDGRIFGGMGMARPIMDFSTAGKEVHIEFRTLGFNQQAR